MWTQLQDCRAIKDHVIARSSQDRLQRKRSITGKTKLGKKEAKKAKSGTSISLLKTCSVFVFRSLRLQLALYLGAFSTQCYTSYANYHISREIARQMFLETRNWTCDNPYPHFSLLLITKSSSNPSNIVFRFILHLLSHQNSGTGSLKDGKWLSRKRFDHRRARRRRISGK